MIEIIIFKPYTYRSQGSINDTYNLATIYDYDREKRYLITKFVSSRFIGKENLVSQNSKDLTTFESSIIFTQVYWSRC